MPFVRYARDRRGYETLYVMHAFDGPERNSRPRVIYACRTVPYAKVGRSTIDESVQRRLEQAYPHLAFDWPRLLKEAAQSAPRPERQDMRAQEPRRGKGKGKGRGSEPQVRQVREVRQVRQVRDQVQQVQEVQEVRQVPEVRVPEAEPFEAPEPLEPITELIEWAGPDPVEPGEPIEPTEPIEPIEPVTIPPLTVDPSWPSVNLVGTTATLVMRGRFIELASKILSRVSDPARQRRLFREAARLNPEGWTTAEQAQAGIDSFEAQYARLAEQLRQ